MDKREGPTMLMWECTFEGFRYKWARNWGGAEGDVVTDEAMSP